MVHGLRSDLRYVLRVLRRSPKFTGVAVLSLALGIGANTAMFGVVRTLLLTPLPVAHPDELHLVTWHRDGDFSISQTGSTSYPDPEGGPSLRSNFSAPLVRALGEAAEREPGAARLFAFAFIRGVGVALDDQPAQLAGGALADGRYFPVLGIPMALGRALGPDDDRPDASSVAVLGHAFWMRAFGGDPGILGRTVRVNGVPVEVVGVTGDAFRGLSMGGFFPTTDITLPMAAQPRVFPRMGDGEDLQAADGIFWLRLMARIPSATPPDRVQTALAAALRNHPSPLLGDDGHRPVLRLLPGGQGAQPVTPETARLLYLLLAVVATVLLIACVNLAGLMLARGVARQRELAVRRALGGPRTRLVRQAMLEAFVLAVAGVAGGLALAVAGRGFMAELLTGSLGAGAFGSLDMQPALDPAVLGLSALLGVGATLVAGLIPALRFTAVDPRAWLGDRAGGGGTPRPTLGRVLIALQIAVSVPLVVGAGLFLRTVSNLGSVDLGFEPSGLVTFQVDPAFTRLPPEEHPRLYQDLLARLESIPGVRAVTLVENALMSGISSNGSVEVAGERAMMYRNAVGPAFLETMGAEMVAGRMPGVQDGPGAPPVGVVNETAVRTLFGGSSPIGRTVTFGGGTPVEVVGVIRDMPYRTRREPVPPTLYDAALQRAGFGGHHVVLRTDRSPARLHTAIQDVVGSVHPDLPVPELQTQAGLIARSSARERVFTRLLALFGGFALLLASIGLHGVTAYSVSRRIPEIGVRMAVGARPGQIVWLVLRQVLALTAIGLVLGIPAALGAGPLVGSLLYGVAPTDLLVLGVSGMVLLSVALLAGLVPALRAGRLDPLRALGAD